MDKTVEDLKELNESAYKSRLKTYDRTANLEELIIKDGMYFKNDELYIGFITKFIDDEDLNCNMLYSLTECIDDKKNGIELIWDFEGRLNPDGIKKDGNHYEEYTWWSKEILKEMRYYKEGELVEKQEWDNSSLQKLM